MQPTKHKLKHNICQALVETFAMHITGSYTSADDKLIMATLAEVKLHIEKKLLQPQKEYSIRLSPAQGLALVIFYDDYVMNYTTQLGNILFQITNKIKQLYL